VLGLVGDDDNTLTLAMASRESWQQRDIVGRLLRRHVEVAFAQEDEILSAINRAYQQRDDASQSLVDGIQSDDTAIRLTGADREDLLDTSGRQPIIQLVNSVLFEAVRARASDIHVQPQEESVVVRQRIDGVLFDVLTVPKDHQEEITSRLKVLGKMNIAEKRLPQDGRATVQVGDRFIDLRIASLPTSFGERVVVRFLDKSARLYTLGELGMDDDRLEVFRRLIKIQHGLLLVTGPTGSGKSTTLYAALQQINAKDLNVLTLEDPIEYQLEGISQTQINTKKGLTFASGLRNVLRQDPDIIMVGEIRDEETAEMAIQSALTGHLVFSTLHTNDAASAVTRLLDLGIEPYLVASSVIAVLAQRLVRRVCPDCRETVTLSRDVVARLGIDPDRLATDRAHRGAGCEACRQTGYRGRLGIFELMEVTESVRTLVQERANAAEIRKTATSAGMRLLHDDGLAKVRDGMTTVDEVVRVTMRETT
jgi:general secretion pathway protein E